jgi:hypothetical protein
MKKLFFHIIIVCLFFIAMKTNSQAQTLVSSKFIPEIGKYEYVIAVNSTKSYRQPFIAGDWDLENNGWKQNPVEEINGMYQFTIVSYNKLVKFYYSDFSKPKAMEKSRFFSSETYCYHVLLKDGNLYSENEIQLGIPGAYGDGFVRWDYVDNTMVVYSNNNVLFTRLINGKKSGKQFRMPLAGGLLLLILKKTKPIRMKAIFILVMAPLTPLRKNCGLTYVSHSI